MIAAFLRELVERGLPSDQLLLVVLAGAKGLRAAVQEVVGDVPVQRCQWHKRENVVSHLAKQHQPSRWRRLQAAYAHGTHGAARRALEPVARELRLVNASAAASLAEGLEETRTPHRLGVFPELGVSFTTTNLAESVMARIEAKTHCIARWRTSDQKVRWTAALGAMERQFRRVNQNRHLPLLKRPPAENHHHIHRALGRDQCGAACISTTLGIRPYLRAERDLPTLAAAASLLTGIESRFLLNATSDLPWRIYRKLNKQPWSSSALDLEPRRFSAQS